jgi:hypothetical protein
MVKDYSDPYGRPTTGYGFGRGGTSNRNVGVRRPVYLNTAVPPSQRNAVFAQSPLPSTQAFESALKQRPGGLGNLGTVESGRGWTEADQRKFRQFVPLPDVADVTGGGGGGGPSRQDLIDAAFAGLPSRDVYTGDADFAALADYYAGQRGQLEDVYGAATGRIGTTTAETLAALQALDPQAAFVYDVGGPTIPDVNVDYLRALGASADPVSAEAQFARELLGYQLAASQRAAEGMSVSLERERQARQAASQLMQQEGLRQAAAARAQALAQIAAQQAAEEAMIRERVRAAQQAEADRQQELDMLRLELQLKGID